MDFLFLAIKVHSCKLTENLAGTQACQVMPLIMITVM